MARENTCRFICAVANPLNKYYRPRCGHNWIIAQKTLSCVKLYRTMKSKILILILALCVVAGASAKSRGVKFRSLDVKEFARYIERGDVVLVDVRTSEEFDAGHITGVDRNLDVRSATFFKDYQSLPKDKRIAVYCKGGGRSKQVAGVLAGNGYKVVELSVGYDGWVKAGGASEKNK